MKSLYPIEIRRINDSHLSVQWSDGKTSLLSSEQLRHRCPCAECRARRGDSSHEKPLTPGKSKLSIIDHSKAESLRLEKIAAVGNYAINFKWGDGHSDGIYSFAYLYELSFSTDDSQGNDT